MIPLYNVNGLVHWTQREIETRERMVSFFASEVTAFLRGENKAWDIERIEAPIMLPRAMVNPNYTDDDLWCFAPHDEDEARLVARPETTPSTYAYMTHRLQSHAGVRLPYCCWQVGKSFRAEQDKVLSHMRLKEFYQMEFQCAFGADTANDYHAKSWEPVRKMIAQTTGLPTRIVESDRLPAYSLSTMDVEVWVPDASSNAESLAPTLVSEGLSGASGIPQMAQITGGRWMEVCSISKRKDFPIRNRFQNKKKEWVETDVLVLEIAVGIDRAVFAWNHAAERA